MAMGQSIQLFLSAIVMSYAYNTENLPSVNQNSSAERKPRIVFVYGVCYSKNFQLIECHLD